MVGGSVSRVLKSLECGRAEINSASRQSGNRRGRRQLRSGAKEWRVSFRMSIVRHVQRASERALGSLAVS